MATPPVKLSFGAAIKGKLPAKAAKPSAFSLQSAEEENESTPSLPFASTSKLTANQPKVSTATLSKAKKKQQEAELLLDSSVYEYDEVYDSMKQGAKMAALAKKQDSGERKPKYISKLMETAETRKRDRVRAEDKMIQKEREREGEEFADKDSFVTPAYLAQQEELKKIEEEEKRKEEAQAAKPGGMSIFYKTYLETNSAEHEAAVAASLAPNAHKPVLGAEPPPAEMSEAELAAQVMRETGRKVEVNDDGIIIDKRELMTGGLNLVKKSTGKPSGGFSVSIKAREEQEKKEREANRESDSALHLLSNGMSAAERTRQARERQLRELERQMLELDAKRKREAEENLQQQVQKVARRNDSSKVEELKRKAEERRLKREQEIKSAQETEK